ASGKMRRPAPSLRRGKYIALMRIEGTIVDGRSGRLPVKPPIDIPLLGEERAGDLSVVPLARQVAADKRAAAVVLYVNSRGGSSTASEAMRLALKVVAARKPIVVVMGAVAGSGGYWIATPVSWIVARPSSQDDARRAGSDRPGQGVDGAPGAGTEARRRDGRPRRGNHQGSYARGAEGRRSGAGGPRAQAHGSAARRRHRGGRLVRLCA